MVGRTDFSNVVKLLRNILYKCQKNYFKYRVGQLVYKLARILVLQLVYVSY